MNGIETIGFKTLNLLSAEQAHRYQVIPASAENGRIIFYVPDRSQTKVDELTFVLGKEVDLLDTDPGVFKRYLAKYYPISVSNMQRQKTQLNEESDVIRFVNQVLDEAVAMKISDIHIERFETFARVRFRWEGQLLEKYEVLLSQYNAIVSRIKIMSELDISEKRLPQDGRIHLNTQGQKIDIRVSIIPGKYGEKVVMRLLTRSQKFLKLENLGMAERELSDFELALKQSNGIILITGPTGSGKTTTLYAGLGLLNDPKVNISTIEDPIEYNIEGINQVQVKEEIGLSFGMALRAFLRQDPDIIMVGEIRDQETAEIAIRASLTGHLVFSTLHTNSAWDAVSRLADMGVEPYLIAASLRMVVAQRLIRQLCEDCKAESQEELFESIQQAHGISTHFVPVGCPSCHYTGYSRRKAIYEVIPVTKELMDKIKQKDLEIESYLVEHNVKTLKQHVLEQVKTGSTSLEETLMYLV